jgi:hypothetical protein
VYCRARWAAAPCVRLQAPALRTSFGVAAAAVALHDVSTMARARGAFATCEQHPLLRALLRVPLIGAVSLPRPRSVSDRDEHRAPTVRTRLRKKRPPECARRGTARGRAGGRDAARYRGAPGTRGVSRETAPHLSCNRCGLVHELPAGAAVRVVVTRGLLWWSPDARHAGAHGVCTSIRRAPHSVSGRSRLQHE